MNSASPIHGGRCPPCSAIFGSSRFSRRAFHLRMVWVSSSSMSLLKPATSANATAAKRLVMLRPSVMGVSTQVDLFSHKESRFPVVKDHTSVVRRAAWKLHLWWTSCWRGGYPRDLSGGFAHPLVGDGASRR